MGGRVGGWGVSPSLTSCTKHTVWGQGCECRPACHLACFLCFGSGRMEQRTPKQELLPRAGRRSDREKNWRVVSVWLAGQEQEALKRSSTSWLWENTETSHTSCYAGPCLATFRPPLEDGQRRPQEPPSDLGSRRPSSGSLTLQAPFPRGPTPWPTVTGPPETVRDRLNVCVPVEHE